MKSPDKITLFMIKNKIASLSFFTRQEKTNNKKTRI